MSARVAAVDVGTNSVRLLVAEAAQPLLVVEREMRITRLGKGVDANGRLDDQALERTLACIDDYAERWQDLGAERVRVTATSAIRDASDRDRFFAAVRERTGVEAEVLSGQEEGCTAFVGATSLVEGEPPYLVLDIGGGSTEFILGDREPDAMTSRQLGCVRLSERALCSDPPTVGEVTEARALVDAELDAVEALFDATSARTLIGVAGTTTTIAALALDLPAYLPERIHGSRVSAERVRSITDELCRLSTAARAELGPMAPGREDVIHAGALILDRVVDRFRFPGVLVSEADILDGLVLGLLNEAPLRLCD
ncbi:MAG: exopolyphosphatase [Nitriliruptorales bacterium]|nr:exopolyphosphatase [Nitriliruptorales bacterium]